MSSFKLCKCGSLASWNSYFGGYYCPNCGLILEDGLPDGGRGGHLMDINQLIADLQEISQKNSISHYKRDRCADAATALSTLRAENEKLRNEVERQRRSADDRKHLYENAERAYMKVVAELEQVKRERDAAVKDLNEFLSMDELCPIQCEWCKWNGTYCDGKTPEWRGQKEG